MESRKSVNPNDRRTRYTRRVIKEAMLALMAKKPFPKITVTELCKEADINRGTFYIHFYDTEDVLDDLLQDAFSQTAEVLDHVLCPERATCTYPLCERIQNSEAYRPLFLDDTVTPKIVERIAMGRKESFIQYVMDHSTLTYEQAEAVFIFQCNGCLTVNRMMLKDKNQDWRSIQSAIDRLLKAGLEALMDRYPV